MDELEFCVSYAVGNAKEDTIYSKDWQDITQSVRKVYNTVERGLLPNPLLAPRKVGAKIDMVQLQEWALLQHNSGLAPPNWIHVGKGWNTVLFPTLAMMLPNIIAMRSARSPATIHAMKCTCILSQSLLCCFHVPRTSCVTCDLFCCRRD